MRNKEKQRIWSKRWAIKNRDKANESNRRLARRTKQKAIDKLGGECAKCGFDDIRALQIDHIKSVGNEIHRGMPIYREILRGRVENLQVLCANCNWIKRYENKEFAAARTNGKSPVS